MYASDEKKPLPTQEEVLVCNEETTAEQVNRQIIYNIIHFLLTFHYSGNTFLEEIHI